MPPDFSSGDSLTPSSAKTTRFTLGQSIDVMLNPTRTCAPRASRRFRIGIQYSAVDASTAPPPIRANRGLPISAQPAVAASTDTIHTTVRFQGACSDSRMSHVIAPSSTPLIEQLAHGLVEVDPANRLAD